MEIKKSKSFYSIEDNIKRHTPEVSDSDIKAFVWYNQVLGYPMTGWEKWMLPFKVKKSIVKTNKKTTLFSNTWTPIREESEGIEIGTLTKFSHEYNFVKYVAIRLFDGSIVLVNELDINKGDTISYDNESLKKLVLDGSLYYLNGELMPLHVYTNNPLSLIKTQLEQDKQYIIDTYSIDVYNNHLNIINSAKRLDVADANEKVKFNIDLRDKIFFSIKKLNTEKYQHLETSYDYEDSPTSNVLAQACYDYMRELKPEEFGVIDKYDFINKNYSNANYSVYGMDEEDKKKGLDVQHKNRVDALITRLTWKFIVSELESSDIAIINKIVNETYNNTVQTNYSKIPVGFVSSTMPFKGGKEGFSLRKTQINAFRFAVAKNSWTIALTVGFGKTSCSIALLSYYISSGICKRPIVIAPKKIVANWVRESNGYYRNDKGELSLTPLKGFTFVSGILTNTGISLDSFMGNLSKSTIEAIKSKKFKFKENTIYSMTYEGLLKLKFDNKNFESIILEVLEMVHNLKFSSIEDVKSFLSGSEGSRKLSATLSKTIQSLISENIVSDGINADEIGFDCVLSDEAHRYKNLFFKSSDEGESHAFDALGKTNTKTPSSTAIKGLMTSIYLRKNGGGVWGFLTATPFMNDPAEIYTAIYFANRSELIKNNVFSLGAFARTFFNYISLVEPNANSFKYYNVVRNFKNKMVFTNIIHNSILIDDGSSMDSGVDRPCLIRYPNKDMRAILKPSILQQYSRLITTYSDVIKEKFKEQYESLSDEQKIKFSFYFSKIKDKNSSLESKYRGKTLALNGVRLSSNNASALSPFAKSPLCAEFLSDTIEGKAEELYEYSPKIKFAIDFINNARSYYKDKGLKESGFIVYMNLGKDLMDGDDGNVIQKAFEMYCGFGDVKEKYNGRLYKEVECIHGDTTDTNKDNISDLFNRGDVKVIIGTSTISEGLNLQENCATILNLTADWNPTQVVQLEGRAYRQGNRHAFVRIITPAVVGSLDSFKYTKFNQKEQRIKDAFSKGILNTTEDIIEEISPYDIAKSLTEDAKQLASLRIGIEKDDILIELKSLVTRKQDLSMAIVTMNRFSFVKNDITSKISWLVDDMKYNHRMMVAIGELIESDEKVSSILKDKYKTRMENWDLLIKHIEIIDSQRDDVDIINLTSSLFSRKSYAFSGVLYDDKKYIESKLKEKGFENTIVTEDGNRDRLITSYDSDRLPLCSFVKTSFFSSDNIFFEYRTMYKSAMSFKDMYLTPYGMDYNSSKEEFESLSEIVSKEINSKVEAYKERYDIELNRGVIEVRPKQEYFDKVKEEESLSISEFNNSSKTSDELVAEFSNKTNMQLTYPFYWIDSIKKMEGDSFNCNNYIPTVECEGCSFDELDVEKEVVIESKETVEDTPDLKTVNVKSKTELSTSKEDTIGRKLYNLLIKTFGVDIDYKKYEVKGWNTFSIEKQSSSFKLQNADNKGSYQLILSDTYVQNGDLMSDPMIWVTMIPSLQIAIPYAYENHGVGVYNEYVDFNKGTIKDVVACKNVAEFIINNLIPSLYDRGAFKKEPQTSYATRIKLMERALEKNPDNKIAKARLKLLKLKQGKV